MFGSRARGDNQERADIDLAILCNNASFEDWLLVRSIIEDADTLLKIDCIRMDGLPETSDLKISIIQQGIKLYEKNNLKMNSNNYKMEWGFLKLGKALISLEKIIVKPDQEDRSNIDAAIQRFEFTIELFWKLLKNILESKE